MKFYYVYVLKSKKDRSLYVGYSTDLKIRLQLHNNGEVLSTKSKLPWDLIFYEAYPTASDAKRRERYFKTTKGKTTLKTMLQGFLNSK